MHNNRCNRLNDCGYNHRQLWQDDSFLLFNKLCLTTKLDFLDPLDPNVLAIDAVLLKDLLFVEQRRADAAFQR
jgi:hypothetical protein